MFVDRTLAARIETAEGHLCAAVAEPLPGSWIVPIGGGLAVMARPGSPVNKLIGLGFDQPLEEGALAELEGRGPVRVELSTLADPAIGLLLSRRGYELQGFEHVLGLELPATPRAPTSPPATGLAVSRTEDEASWGETSVEGFIHPDETSGHAETFPRDIVEEVMSDMMRATGFRRYLARIGDEVAGAASIRIGGGIAIFSGATTLPAFRRRGVQSALLAARLADAAAAECRIAVITTAPGTQSQSNSTRHGFRMLYARAILTRG